MSTDDALRQIVGHMSAAQIPYLLTGSFAAGAHGFLRTTYDFDFVIDPDASTLASFLERLPPERYYVSEVAAREALRGRSMFNVIDQETNWKFDLIVSRRDDFTLNQFDRRELTVVSGVEVWVASAEDVIVSKLVWARTSRSERQLRDVSGVLDAQRPRLDFKYIEDWVERLRVGDLWRQVLDMSPPV